MIKYLVEILIVLFVTILIVGGLYSIRSNRLATIIRDLPEDTEVVCFGSSHASAFDFRNYSVKSTIINTGGNTLYYDLQNFKMVKEKLKPGSIVLLSMAYFSFGSDENRTQEDNDAFLTDYYEFMPKSSIYKYDIRKKLGVYFYRAQKNVFGFFRLDPLDEVIPKVVVNVNKKPNQNVNNKGYQKKLQKQRKKKKRDLVYHASHRARKHMRDGTYVGHSDRSLPYLEEIIVECKALGLRPFLVTPPFYKSYNQRFKKGWLYEHYYKYIFYLTKKHGIDYIDYSNDHRLTKNELFFRNSDHLSRNGKMKFQERFYHEFLRCEL